MKNRLFIDADTCYNFKSITQAMAYVHKHHLTRFMILTTYSYSKAAKVYNPFMRDDYKTAYFNTHDSALKYIGNFI